MLQAHREMQILQRRGFIGDARVSHILNLHLQDNAVMRSEFALLKKTMDQLVNEVKDTKVAADRAMTEAKKRKT